MKDYNIKIVFRNNRILQAIEDAGYSTQADCARGIGMSATGLNALVAMRKAPIASNGEISVDAQLLMDGLCLLPEDLWSQDQLFGSLKRNTFEVEMSTVEAISLVENKKELLQLMAGASPPLKKREVLVLQGRFYNEETLQEIADRHDVCKQRVRQVEGTALRKIRRGEIKNEKMA